MTVKHLLSGTGFLFTDIGDVPLKGIEETYRIFALKEKNKVLRQI